MPEPGQAQLNAVTASDPEANVHRLRHRRADLFLRLRQVEPGGSSPAGNSVQGTRVEHWLDLPAWTGSLRRHGRARSCTYGAASRLHSSGDFCITPDVGDRPTANITLPNRGNPTANELLPLPGRRPDDGGASSSESFRRPI